MSKCHSSRAVISDGPCRFPYSEPKGALHPFPDTGLSVQATRFLYALHLYIHILTHILTTPKSKPHPRRLFLSQPAGAGGRLALPAKPSPGRRSRPLPLSPAGPGCVSPSEGRAGCRRSRRTGKCRTPPPPISPPSPRHPGAEVQPEEGCRVPPTFPLRCPEVGPEEGARLVCAQAGNLGATQPRPLK